MTKKFDSIQEALEDLKLGKMIILVDDEDRENEGDLCCAAEMVTPEIVNFMARHARGLICLSIDENQVDKLQLPMMTTSNRSPYHTNFTVSIEAAHGVSTGISAEDRAHTIRTAIKPDVTPEDIVVPGHVFPVKALNGGVLQRAGQTEGSVDLSRLAGLHPSGVICEIMNEDGSMSRYEELKAFSIEHKLKIVTVKDLIAYRLRNEKLIQLVKSEKINTTYGDLTFKVYQNSLNDEVYFAFIKGEVSPDSVPLIRVHAQNRMADSFEFLIQPNTKIQSAFKMISKNESGVFLYLLRNRNGDEVLTKVNNFFSANQSEAHPQSNDGSSMIFREYGFGAQVIYELGYKKIKLITDNPKNFIGLESYGLNIVDFIPFSKI